MRRVAGAVAALLVAMASPARAQTCPLVNLMPAYWQVVEESVGLKSAEQIERFREKLVIPNDDLYGENGVGFASSQALDQAILQSLARSRRDHASALAKETYLQQHLPELVQEFQRRFPDFRCDFPIYLLPSLGQMDGAGRKVNGRPAMLLGVDVIAVVHETDEMAVFLDHELFHRYHFQAAGMSDDDGERAPIWKALWVEGLATHASKELAGVSYGAALFDRGLVKNANAKFPDLIAEITENFDKIDRKAYSRLFMGQPPGTDPPPRSGYYIGALAAQELAKTMTMAQMAHLTDGDARTRLLGLLPALRPAAAE